MISRIIISKNRHTVHTVLCQMDFSVRKIAPLICQHLPQLKKKRKKYNRNFQVQFCLEYYL